jgi:hypothetical protein
MNQEDDSITRHERWLAEHEAMMRLYDRNRLELQEEMKLTWASIRANSELLYRVIREGEARMQALDRKLLQLADLMIGHYGGNGHREPRA